MSASLGSRGWSLPRPRLPLVPLPLALLAAAPGLAEGFRSPTAGTHGLGASGGRLAYLQDASAATHNPANLVDLARWEVAAEPTFVHHAATFTAPSGATTRTREPWKILPSFFAGGPLEAGRLAAGVGIHAPYGLALDWEPDGPLRGVAPFLTELRTINVNPSLAFRLAEGLNAAAGLNTLWSELRFQQVYPWSAATGIAGLPDGELRARGDGIGWGGNFALTWEIAGRHRLAATVRSPMDVDYQGRFGVTSVPTLGFGELATPLATAIRFPTIVSLGYGVRVTDTVLLEAGGEWLQFSRFQALDLQVEGSLPGLVTRLPQDWRDTFTAGFSARWDFAPGWQLRGGYQHFQSPVPDATLSPLIPDARQNVVTAGVGWRTGRHRLDLAYSRVFYEDRQTSTTWNPGFAGRYEIDAHLMSAGYGFSF